MARIDLSRQAADFLRSLPANQGRQIAEKLAALAADPDALPSEGLRGYAPLSRLRSGEYRIIYSVEDEVLRVRLTGKRNDDEIYKALERAWKK